jgi:hypothetical protein
MNAWTRVAQNGSQPAPESWGRRARPRSPAWAGVVLVVGLTVWTASCATESGGPPGAGGPSRRGAARARQEPPALWKQYDLHGDGIITHAEFMAVRAVCFAKADTNGDGILTLAEVQRAAPAQPPEQVAAWVARLDVNHEGGISRDAFDRESDRLFRQLDTNGDGVLAGSELTHMTPAVLGPLCVEPAGRPPAPGRR